MGAYGWGAGSSSLTRSLGRSGRARQDHSIRDNDPLSVVDLPLLRTRRRRPRQGLAGEQGAEAGVGGLCRGREEGVVEGGASTGAVAVLAGTDAVTSALRARPACVCTGGGRLPLSEYCFTDRACSKSRRTLLSALIRPPPKDIRLAATDRPNAFALLIIK